MILKRATNQLTLTTAAGGASVGLQPALNVGNATGIIGLIALINGILGGIGGWFGMEHLTL
ncbi:hypothetical protein O9929_08270 [Vibrio lentus]|nr:hypothetical protein [Vibrio lentus]